MARHSLFALKMGRRVCLPPGIVAVAPRREHQEITDHQAGGDDDGEKLFQPVQEGMSLGDILDHPV